MFLDPAQRAADVRPAVGVCAGQGDIHAVGTFHAVVAEPEVDGAGVGRLAALGHDEPVDWGDLLIVTREAG